MSKDYLNGMGISDRKFYFKLQEFYKERNLNKFKTSGYNSPKFKDGKSMNKWFTIYSPRIMEKTCKLSVEIISQYKNYLMVINSKEISEVSVGKYNRKNRLIEFEDGTYMRFKPNKIIEESKASLIQIKLQNDFMDKLKEFALEKDLNKFYYKSDLKFEDGTNKNSWFRYNKPKIMEGTGELFDRVREQYKNYIMHQNEISIFVNKLKEFALEKDLNKFNSKKIDMKFKDGTCMGTWFIAHKDKILKGTDPVSKKIQEQYTLYKMKCFNYVDGDEVKNKALIRRKTT